MHIEANTSESCVALWISERNVLCLEEQRMRKGTAYDKIESTHVFLFLRKKITCSLLGDGRGE
jgi:hypothetical protein